MSKPKYDDEQALRKYIQTIVSHRDKETALAYIKSRLDYYSFSPEFASWANDLCDKLCASSTHHAHHEMFKPELEKLPKIIFNQLSEERETNHLRIAKLHVKDAEATLFGEIDTAKNEMSDLRDLIRHSSNSDKPDLIREHLNIAHRKEELQYEARFATSAINNPYFGRFDFRNEDESESIFYISKTNIDSYVNDHHNVHFIDWRAPVADVFYRYQSPSRDIYYKNDAGEKCLGDLALTARFKIENGIIKSISYSASRDDKKVASAAEDILQEKLESNSGEHMSEIVETIQPEQNVIVRHNPDEDMIVQGVAGSGKTAVALHRIAYLIYQKPELRHGGVLFMSPNEDFSEYVSDVLPELGEFYIPIVTFDQIVKYVFKGKIPDKKTSADDGVFRNFIEKYYKDEKLDKNTKSKFTSGFCKQFYRLCNQVRNDGSLRKRYLTTNEEIPSVKEDIKNYTRMIKTYQQIMTANSEERSLYRISISEASKKQAELIAKRDEARKRLSALKKTLSLAESKMSQKPDTFKIEKEKDLITKKESVKVRIIKQAPQYFKSICGENIGQLKSYENVPFLAILRFLISQANGENKENLSVRHIVIDEAQDYIEPYVYFLRIAFPNAVFTILGDVNQNLNPYYRPSSLEKLLPDSEYFEMDKAYRSSPEIVTFCNNILDITSVKPVRKSNGEKVNEISAMNLAETIKAAADYYRKKGYGRIGVITKSLITKNALADATAEDDVMILPVYQAKGLEFDVAIVIDEYKVKERELYYAACSRAQHGLTVIHAKAKTSTKIHDLEPDLEKRVSSDTKKSNSASKKSSRKNATKKTGGTPKTSVIRKQGKGFFSKLKSVFRRFGKKK